MVELGWMAGVMITVLVIGLIVMVGDWVGPDLVFAAMVGVLMASRVIDTKAGASGFSNTGVLTVVTLYVVAEGVSQTGGLDRLMTRVLGFATSPFWGLVRMMVPAAITSAFLNNTPIVALMIPILQGWGRRCNISPKKLLIPLSYACIFGGTLTLMGTSTNLVISGFQAKRYPGTPDAVFSFFQITPFGLPYAVTGFLYTVVAARWLLPNDTGSRPRESLMTALAVPPGSKIAGQTLAASGLTALGGAELSGITREGAEVSPIGPHTLLAPHDVLYIRGDLHEIEGHAHRLGLLLLTSDNIAVHPGAGGALRHSSSLGREPSVVTPAAPSQRASQGAYGVRTASALNVVAATAALSSPANPVLGSLLLRAIVRKNSSLINLTVKDVNFRERYSASLVAVTRSKNGPQALADVKFIKGDLCMLAVDPAFNIESGIFKEDFEKVQVVYEQEEKEFAIGYRVLKSSRAANKSLASAGLSGINGLYAVAIDRAGSKADRETNILGTTPIHVDDIVWFAASLPGILFLSKEPGLENVQSRQLKRLKVRPLYRNLVQAVVPPTSPLVGLTPAEACLRRVYDAVALGVHRSGEDHLVVGDVSHEKLQAGDLLLLETGVRFTQIHQASPAFSLLVDVPKSSPLKTRMMWPAVALVVAMVTTQIVGGVTGTTYIDLWTCAILVAAVMLLLQCMSADQARKSIDWTVFITIAFAFGVSAAMENSGVAQAIADLFVSVSKAIGGQAALLSCIYLVTGLLSEILTNNAAAALMYPIAASAGDDMGVPPYMMSISLMLGASASFISPFGYQCNLMVFAAGGYRTVDFVRFGTLLQLWQFIVVIILFLFYEDINIICGVAGALFVFIIAVPLVYSLVWKRKRAAASTGDDGDKQLPAGSTAGSLLPVKQADTGGKALPSPIKEVNSSASFASRDVNGLGGKDSSNGGVQP